MSAILIKLDYLSAFCTIVNNFFPIIHVKSYSLYGFIVSEGTPTTDDRGKECPLLYVCFLFSRIRVVVFQDQTTGPMEQAKSW